MSDHPTHTFSGSPSLSESIHLNQWDETEKSCSHQPYLGHLIYFSAFWASALTISTVAVPFEFFWLCYFGIFSGVCGRWKQMTEINSTYSTRNVRLAVRLPPRSSAPVTLFLPVFIPREWDISSCLSHVMQLGLYWCLTLSLSIYIYICLYVYSFLKLLPITLRFPAGFALKGVTPWKCTPTGWSRIVDPCDEGLLTLWLFLYFKSVASRERYTGGRKPISSALYSGGRKA